MANKKKHLTSEWYSMNNQKKDTKTLSNLARRKVMPFHILGEICASLKLYGLEIQKSPNISIGGFPDNKLFS